MSLDLPPGFKRETTAAQTLSRQLSPRLQSGTLVLPDPNVTVGISQAACGIGGLGPQPPRGGL